MTPSEKFIEEKKNLKEIRKERILKAAFELFSLKGIDTIAMTDIAERAEIGVASLYRYFETKEEIAIRTTIWVWSNGKKQLMPRFTTPEFQQLTGLEQVRKFCESFIDIYELQTSFLRYIFFFDSFAFRTQIKKSRLKDYEEIILSVEKVVEDAIKKGLKDGSINSKYKDKSEILYFSLMHTLFSTAQKLALGADLLEIDTFEGGKKQLQQVTEILIDGLK